MKIACLVRHQVDIAAAVALAILLALPADANEPLVRAVVDHDGVVIACTVDGKTTNGRDCPTGNAVISEFIDVRDGTFDLTEYDGTLKIGLPPGLERADPKACSAVIVDKLTPDPPARRVGTVTFKALNPDDAALKSAVADAFYLRDVRLKRAFDITIGQTSKLYFLASNEDEAYEYARPTWPFGDRINYYVLAGFLETNSDGRHVADVGFSEFDSALTDAGPFFDLLGVALLNGKLRLVVTRGIQLSPGKALTDLHWVLRGEQQSLCM
jgi:hypothetical protein